MGHGRGELRSYEQSFLEEILRDRDGWEFTIIQKLQTKRNCENREILKKKCKLKKKIIETKALNVCSY